MDALNKILGELADDGVTIDVSFGVRPRCLCGKARYATEREANRDARRMKYKGRGHGYKGLLRPYQCPERKGIWHVGHKDE